MKKRRVLSLLLVLCLALALLPSGAGAADYIEVSSVDEMERALADTPAQPMNLRSAASEPIRMLVLEPALPDTCGARRVLHYAAYDEFVLEFASRAEAEAAYGTLTGTFGLKNCWLDIPEESAGVLDTGATPMSASSWGINYMHLTAYRSDADTLAHFNAAQPCVAIIDSGVDPEAENLVARSYLSHDFVHNTDALSEVTAAGEVRGHGTRVASILDEVLPKNVRFMYLRVFDANGAGHVPVLSAIQHATEHGADVINFSLGWETDYDHNYAFLDAALKAANDKGISIVCAAGNEQQDVENSYPASSKYTIAVSGINQRLLFDSFYSNFGEKIDFCAPGSGISATTLGGVTVGCAGTSFAAPHITAAVTELKILEPSASVKRINDLLKACAEDLGDPGKDAYYGSGFPVLPEDCSERITHLWDEGHLTREATARKDGERVYSCTVCGRTRTEIVPATGEAAKTKFKDVPDSEYYAVPVAWAAANGITKGTDETHFSPNRVCTRAQVVTFLWRAAGSPHPKTTRNRFVDVERGAYYYDAVLWAVENGITKGTSDTTFAPEDTCTRAHVVTFLWRFDKNGAGAVTMETDLTNAATPFAVAFTDVPAGAYYAEAVTWAMQNGITKGMTPTTFGPDAGCTRAHVVSFLYRYANGAE